jgi:hypothetical protein
VRTCRSSFGNCLKKIADDGNGIILPHIALQQFVNSRLDHGGGQQISAGLS